MSGQLVDWDLAVATAGRLVPPGPVISPEDAAAVVSQLRELSEQAARHVHAFTGLDPEADGAPVAVVDRRGWVEANTDGFRLLLDPVLETLLARRREVPGGALVTAVGSKITGVQVGAVLAYLSARVLGQYELFVPPGPAGTGGDGRLTLVAPNIVATERSLGVDPHDFRLWVCLHEMTHRAQFVAVPWLRDHVRAEMTAFLLASDLDPGAVLERLRAAFGAIADAVRNRTDVSLLEVIQTPEQREILDRLTGVMSLVEGHGEYVMDGVGPDVVPTVSEIRRRFDNRRRQSGPVERALRRLLGIELKMKQYAQGERFVREVVDAVGMAGFNQVWTSPATLPRKAEITDPRAWVRRVVGEPPALAR